jgi:hypothetical protein
MISTVNEVARAGPAPSVSAEPRRLSKNRERRVVQKRRPGLDFTRISPSRPLSFALPGLRPFLQDTGGLRTRPRLLSGRPSGAARLEKSAACRGTGWPVRRRRVREQPRASLRARGCRHEKTGSPERATEMRVRCRLRLRSGSLRVSYLRRRAA